MAKKRPFYSTYKGKNIYIIYNDINSNSFVFKRSFRQIYLEITKDFEEINNPIKNKIGKKALELAKEFCYIHINEIEKLPSIKKKLCSIDERISKGETLKFNEYILNFWDWNNSDWVKRKLLEKKDSISQSYVSDQLSAYRTHIAPLIDDELVLSQFNVNLVEDIKTSLLEEKEDYGTPSSSTINKTLRSIRIALADAYRRGYIKDNIASRISNVATDTRERGILKEEELAKLINYLNKYRTGKNRWEYLFICLGIFTGAREMEIATLRPTDFSNLNEENYKIVISKAYNRYDGMKKTKTKEDRIATCPKWLGDEILSYTKTLTYNSGLIFSNEEDHTKPITQNKILKAFYNALYAIGIDEEQRKERNIVFHSLRHGFATMLSRETDIRTLKKATGHATDSMAEHYSNHQMEQDALDIAEATTKAFKNIQV